MKLIFTELGWEDYLWFQTNERKLVKKINTLIQDIQRMINTLQSTFERAGGK